MITGNCVAHTGLHRRSHISLWYQIINSVSSGVMLSQWAGAGALTMLLLQDYKVNSAILGLSFSVCPNKNAKVRAESSF